MIQKISQQPLAKRFDHLRGVIASPRFLQMRGLNNDLPFYICEFKASEAFEIQRMRRQLVNTLAGLQVECLQCRGIKVLEINLYDLTIDMLKAREGSNEGSNLWDEILAAEPEVEKEALQELLQNVLDIKGHLIPEIGERLAQSTAKDKPTVMFFPGEYRHSLEQGASLELFGLLHDDKYYRAFNIFDIKA
jgi:hypothetical protein